MTTTVMDFEFFLTFDGKSPVSCIIFAADQWSSFPYKCI